MSEYEDEEKLFAKFKRVNGYYSPKRRCCKNCKHSTQASVEDSLLCVADRHIYTYTVNSVHDLDVCDLWEQSK